MLLTKPDIKHWLLVGLTLLAASSHAQTIPTASLKTLAGFAPSIVNTENEANYYYKTLFSEPFRGRSGCFQRAHIWSYQMFKRFNVRSMKAFLFFTQRYKREFDYQWTYHVAPLVPVKMSNGIIQELVFDPTFVNAPSWETGEARKAYDNKPIPIAEWIKYFIFPEGIECPVVENYEDFLAFQEKHYCYIMKTPMYTYIPSNFQTETEVRKDWREGDLKQMRKAFKLEYR